MVKNVAIANTLFLTTYSSRKSDGNNDDNLKERERERKEGIDDKGQICCQTPTPTQFWPFLWDGMMKMRERGGSWGVYVKVWWGIVSWRLGVSCGRNGLSYWDVLLILLCASDGDGSSKSVLNLFSLLRCFQMWALLDRHRDLIKRFDPIWLDKQWNNGIIWGVCVYMCQWKYNAKLHSSPHFLPFLFPTFFLCGFWIWVNQS